MTDDPDFYAWLDGELPQPQASAMAARVAADPELAAFAEQHQALAGRLDAAFAPVLAAPLPDSLRQAAGFRDADIIDFAEALERRRRWSVAGLAAAASLALGLAIGVTLPRDGGSFRSEGGQLAAAGALGEALDRQLASAGDSGGIRMGLTFREKDGRYCRTFTAAAQSGLACRLGDSWLLEGLVRNKAPAGEYRMAAGQNPALAAIVDAHIGGEPLDAEAEALQVEQGWEANQEEAR